MGGLNARENLGPTTDEAVRRHAAERPDARAVVGARASMTWRELDAAADRVSAMIAGTGGMGSRVAWLGQNDVGYPTVLLGAVRQRSALVGLNWRLPDADISASCVEVGVTHVFTSAAFADRARHIAAEGVHVEVVDETTSDPWPEVAPVPALVPEADDLGVVFFTSGSTGVPKAVPLTRRAVEAHAHTPVTHGFDTDSRLLIVPPVFHLAGACWVHYGLIYGACQYYLAEATPAAIVRAMAEHRITQAVYVPTLIRMIVDELKARPVPLPDFRHMAYGASPMPPALLREAIEVLGCEFCQVFGMTEAGGVVTVLQPGDHVLGGDHPERLGSAGRVNHGVEVEIRDPLGDPVAPGGSGVLWFRTPFMSQGYLARPEETERIFVDGWLNTRDVGHMDADGYIYVSGRADDMIITGGENVHPEEVEAALAECPSIVEAAVLGVPDERWGRSVCAAVVRRDAGLSEDKVVSHCRELLAGYKVPRSVVFVDQLPRNAAGKVARAVLEREVAGGGS